MNWIKNSGIYSTLNVLLDLAVTSTAGWAFARYNFKFKEFIFYSIIIFMMIPGILLVVPMYVEVVNLNGINNIWALVLPWTAADAPIGILILRRFFQTQPLELFEAAKVDGASEFRVFFQIAIPLAKPALTTVAILDIIFTINDFIWPMLIMTKSSLQPLAVGMLSYSPGSGGSIGWGSVFAAYTLASIPMLIFFALFARQFVEAITEGAIK
ncbi:MAG: carbohydrate ABC transporter permease [Candidatus Parvarchaeota archaeon]|nr:carbohydrate ABC transporter permease [Candidatus Jingweiarchaeum tengchongense]